MFSLRKESLSSAKKPVRKKKRSLISGSLAVALLKNGHRRLFPRCESLIHFSGMPYKKRQPGTMETSMERIIQEHSAAPPGAAECFTLFSLQDYGINMYVIQRYELSGLS